MCSHAGREFKISHFAVRWWSHCMHDQVLMALRWRRTKGIFYSSFSSNLFECMNNEESGAAVYWTLYLWAPCIRKCNSWMIEKPIKVVIKLQMSPLSVSFCCHSVRAAEHVTLTNCAQLLVNTFIAVWYRECRPLPPPLPPPPPPPHHIQFLPVASVRHLVRSIFFNYAKRGQTFL